MTDVNVQFFSHLNGLNLNNNWGDLIRLLDICLVNGKPLPSIILQTVDPESGDITLEFSANHSCMLFQIVELNGFNPSSVNTKYRVKGVPNGTTLILKADNKDLIITSVGTSKLSPLGYDIIFRDEADVKRVYRAKNPTAQHPFIRVDESLTSPDGTTGVYTSNYAKYAMVGLLEHMEHIDDYENPDVLQLPFDIANPAKNWKITGTGTGVVRGWSRWHFTKPSNNSGLDSGVDIAGNRRFTLCGDSNAFYLLRNLISATDANKILSGCGLYEPSHDVSVIPNWFLMTWLTSNMANTGYNHSIVGGSPLGGSASTSGFFTAKNNVANRLTGHTASAPILPDYNSGYSGLYSATNVAALQVPFNDAEKYLRGTLNHICYAGSKHSTSETLPVLGDKSMYVFDSAIVSNIGGFYFYLGELE